MLKHILMTSALAIIASSAFANTMLLKIASPTRGAGKELRFDALETNAGVIRKAIISATVAPAADIKKNGSGKGKELVITLVLTPEVEEYFKDIKDHEPLTTVRLNVYREAKDKTTKPAIAYTLTNAVIDTAEFKRKPKEGTISATFKPILELKLGYDTLSWADYKPTDNPDDWKLN